MNSPLIISLTDNTNSIFRIQDAVSNQRLEFKRGCQLDSYQGLTGATPYRLWLGWNTGDVILEDLIMLQELRFTVMFILHTILLKHMEHHILKVLYI